jgi:hypothetical protein
MGFLAVLPPRLREAPKNAARRGVLRSLAGRRWLVNPSRSARACGHPYATQANKTNLVVSQASPTRHKKTIEARSKGRRSVQAATAM